MNTKFVIDIPKICAHAAQYQESNEDISFPFYRAFHDLYPEAGDLACDILENNILEEHINE